MTDLNIEHEKILKNAARDGDFDKLIIALEVYGVNPQVSNNAALRFAVSHSIDKKIRYRMTEELLKRGADPSASNYLVVNNVIIMGDADLLYLFLKHEPAIIVNANISHSISASMAKDNELETIIDTLIEYGMTPSDVLNCSHKIRPSLLEYLVSKGGDITVNDGIHAYRYFDFLNLAPTDLLAKFDKHIHPYILRFMTMKL